MKVIRTDNFGRDYPHEYFVTAVSLSEDICEEIALILNEKEGEGSPDFYRVVEDNYELSKEFEP